MPFGDKANQSKPPDFDLELEWCTTNDPCPSITDPGTNTPALNVAFSVQAVDPPRGTTNLTSSQIQQVEIKAGAAFILAFRAYNVNAGAGHQGTNTVYVIGQELPGTCGGTGGVAKTWSVDYFPNNAKQAQYAIGDTAGTITQSLVQAIGEGIGNNAAHEIAHQLEHQYLTSGKIVNGMGLDNHNAESFGTYNDGSCDGSNASWVYTGVATDGTAIHWGTDAHQSLLNILGKRQ